MRIRRGATLFEVLLVVATAIVLFEIAAYARRAHGAENFAGADAAIVERAETARRDLALFWFDRPLPRWSSSCPITVRETADGSGGGLTAFSFDRGEVFGWRMRLQGPRGQVLDSIVPHEVHHTILASELRRPLPRWLDEGAAGLFESPEEHAHFRRLAKQFANHPARALQHPDEMAYPTRPENVLPLYVTGHSVVEWLLAEHGRERFLTFLRDTRPPSQSLREHFEVGPAELDSRWQRWIAAVSVDCIEGGCPLHSHRAPVPQTVLRAGAPVMEVYTAKLCIPCAAFWLDYRTDGAFQSAIAQRVHVVPIDVDIEPHKARARGVTGVPSFAIGSALRTNYPGKRQLVGWIDSAIAQAPAVRPPDCAAPPNTTYPTVPTIPPAPPPPDDPPRLVPVPDPRFAAIEARLAALEQRAAVPGPAGPAGPPGPVGPQGVPGPQGAAGVVDAASLNAIKGRLDRLDAIRIPVQILDESGRVIDSESVPLGEPIKLRGIYRVREKPRANP